MLIELNNAREKLEFIDKESLIDVLKKKEKGKNYLTNKNDDSSTPTYPEKTQETVLQS